MEFHCEDRNGTTLVAVHGEIDSSTAPQLQECLFDVLNPGCRILLEVSRVGFMSSAGLRVLLLLYRQINGLNGVLVLVGVSPDIQAAMDATGFLKHFVLADTVEEGLEVLAA